MNRVLLATNVVIGSFNTGVPMGCPGAFEASQAIIGASRACQAAFFVNDAHDPDDIEFNYVPPHLLASSIDALRHIQIERDLACPMVALNKKQWSAVRDPHNLKVISSVTADHILVAGYCMSFDVLATVLDLIQIRSGVALLMDGVGDVSPESKERSISQVRWMGVPIIHSSEL